LKYFYEVFVGGNRSTRRKTTLKAKVIDAAALAFLVPDILQLKFAIQKLFERQRNAAIVTVSGVEVREVVVR